MWGHQHCCGCNVKPDCCAGGMALDNPRLGLYAPSAQVCVYEPSTPIKLTVGVTGSYLETVLYNGDPCNPYTTAKAISGTMVVESDDTNPNGSAVFNQLCSPKYSQHFVNFSVPSSNPITPTGTTTSDDACFPAVVDSGRVSVTAQLKPFWNVVAATDWLTVQISGVCYFTLTESGGALGSVRNCMGLASGSHTITGSRTFTGSDPCVLDTSVTLNHSSSASFPGVGSSTLTATCTITTKWENLYRCNPEELAALHRAQLIDGRRPDQLSRILAGGRMA